MRNLFLALLLLTLALASGCRPPEVAPDSVRLASDPASSAELDRLRARLASGAPLQPGEYRSLQQLLARYPDYAPVRESYKSALIQRSDWEALGSYLEGLPPEQRSLQDRRNLAAVHFRLGRHEELVVAARALLVELPDDLEVSRWLASGQLQLGQAEDAAHTLDGLWPAILAAGDAASMTLRGQIHLSQADPARAIEAFSQSLARDPADKAALNGMSRAHHLLGQEEAAEAFRQRAVAVQEQATRAQQRALHQVARLHELERAWKQGRDVQVVALARELLGEADPALAAVLQEYIVAAERRIEATGSGAAAGSGGNFPEGA